MRKMFPFDDVIMGSAAGQEPLDEIDEFELQEIIRQNVPRRPFCTH